jgi:hypothetical protein
VLCDLRVKASDVWDKFCSFPAAPASRSDAHDAPLVAGLHQKCLRGSHSSTPPIPSVLAEAVKSGAYWTVTKTTNPQSLNCSRFSR